MVKVEEDVKYLVFDIETIVDGELVKKVNYPDESLSAKAARERYGAERKASHGTDFIPITYHIPVSIAVAKISADFSLINLQSFSKILSLHLKKKGLICLSKPSDLWLKPKMSELFRNNVRDPRSQDPDF